MNMCELSYLNLGQHSKAANQMGDLDILIGSMKSYNSAFEGGLDDYGGRYRSMCRTIYPPSRIAPRTSKVLLIYL